MQSQTTDNQQSAPKSNEGLLADRIASAIRATVTGTKARAKALSEIKWRLESASGLVAGLGVQSDCILCDASSPQAQVFDGRDNEAMKIQMYQSLLGVKLYLTLLP